MNKIHKLAIIEDGAKIGDNCTIEAYAYVGPKVVLGNNVHVKQGARILGNTSIGENTVIYSYACIGDIPQDISYTPDQEGGLIIGANCVLREFVTISSGTAKGDGYTRVGDNAFIMAYVHIAHDCLLGKNVIMANSATLAGHVQIGDYSVIGGLTPIHQFVKIGESCMIAGASALGQDVVPFCLVEGNRAIIKGLNIVGLKRRFPKEEIVAIRSAYRVLFKGSIKDNAKELLSKTNNENVKKMCTFILENKRGIPLNTNRGNNAD